MPTRAPALNASRRLLALSDRHNILLMMADDLGFGDFTSRGNDFVSTPNLDRLRSEAAPISYRFHGLPIGAGRLLTESSRRAHGPCRRRRLRGNYALQKQVRPGGTNP